MATKHKLAFDATLEQTISLLIPEIPQTEDWDVEFDIELGDTNINNALFSRFRDQQNNYNPYMVLESDGQIREVTAGASVTTQGSGLDFSGRLIFKMTHLEASPNEVTYNVNGATLTVVTSFKAFPEINTIFGLIRTLAGNPSYYYSANFYSLKVTSNSFTETWDANLITSAGNKTTLPSLSGNRDATLPNGATSVAYDDGTGTPANTRPVAVIGADSNINTAALFTADLSGSYDDDGDTITYSSTLSVPAGSSATLSGADTAAPSFTPDVDGTYEIASTVNDGTEDSNEVTQTLTATTPSGSISDAGNNSVQYVGANVALNGASSVGSSFSWSILQAPPASTATITNATSQSASITLTDIGLYEFQLNVDGELSSVFVRVRAAVQLQTPVATIGFNGTPTLNEKITLIAKGSY